VARYAMLYKSGTANSITNPVIAFVLLDTTPADVTTTTGNQLVDQHACERLLHAGVMGATCRSRKASRAATF
jgi:hypothetical protein